MILTVTMNPAIDKIVEVNELRLGSVHRISNTVSSIGGKSINVSRILTGLKVENKALCYLGEDNYKQIEKNADHEGLQLSPILVSGLTRTNVKIIEPDQKYRTTDLNEPGFEVNPEQVSLMNKNIIAQSDDANYVVMSGSLPKGIEQHYYRDIGKAITSKTRLVVDADGAVLMDALEASPYLIKPNIHELEAALDKELNTVEAVVESARNLIKKFGITYILVSMGEDGSILVGEKVAIQGGIIKVEAVSTVGAGDSMLAGFIYGLEKYKGLDEETMLKEAIACGAASSAIAISTLHHTTFTEEQLHEKKQLVPIKVL